MAGETYEIRTVADFWNVPEDRLDLCYREFGQWLKLHLAMRILQAGMAEAFPGVEMKTDDTCFRWIDDDKGEAILDFKNAPDGEIIASQVLNISEPSP
ncbi:hypothetical protein [Roseomonas xinghualingensis]|uniref:hypothetical protein n=1 Tax=Roseomonas xinghualingensis TaxID=2986475 RepID=UPI0021F1E53A|nr:hypothetical protein [Roseomonas sp. SXEYE001]MCV4208587.1 hypothetical protein [Roseomonas sp. SXEYE001]